VIAGDGLILPPVMLSKTRTSTGRFTGIQSCP